MTKPPMRISAEWLFETIGGSGNVVETCGIDGVPADTDRQRLPRRRWRNIRTLTWSPRPSPVGILSTGAQQALDLITTQEIDGIRTWGIDYPVVEQFQAANVDYVPIVMPTTMVLRSSCSNSLTTVCWRRGDQSAGNRCGWSVDCPRRIDRQRSGSAYETLLTPQVYATDNVDGLNALYAPDEQPGWSTYVNIEPYTHYSGSADVSACKAPGE
ncbi:MAG: hypothetical protein R2932_21110 [Caldilineaceae bacterium]